MWSDMDNERGSGSMAKSKVRYGTKIRKRVKAIEVLQRARHECPTCGKKKVRRKSVALWECGGCGAVFAGGAYSPRTSVGETTRRIMEGMRATKTEAVEE
jgi:large subunit ribosomal protein L37Ae